MLRRLALGLLAVLILAVAGHAALWWGVTSRLMREAEAAIAAERAAGAAISHGAMFRGGYPFDARVTLPAMRFAGPVSGPGGATVAVSAAAEAVTLVMSPRAPRSVLAEIACRCDLGLAGAPAMPVDAGALRAEIPLGDGAPVLTGRDIILYSPEGALSISRLRASMPAVGRAAAVDAWGIMLPQPGAGGQLGWPLGRRIASLSAEATLRGVLPAHASTARSLAAWRDSGGALSLDRLALVWGPLSLRAAGTLSLDAALQPRAAATAWLQGFGPTLDRLVAARLIGPSPASIVKLALTATSRPGEGGERVAEIPLTLEDRELAVARIPIARLPFVVWPDTAWLRSPR